MDPLHLTFDAVRTDSDDNDGLEEELENLRTENKALRVKLADLDEQLEYSRSATVSFPTSNCAPAGACNTTRRNWERKTM